MRTAGLNEAQAGIKIYTIFTQQQGINFIQVPVDHKPRDTGTYPET